MKKILSVVVVCIMLLTMSVSVFADTVDPTTVADTVNGGWTTAGTNADYAGKMMTILVYEQGQTPSVDSIQYIDQTVADSTTGAYAFTGYLPIDDPVYGSPYVVKVGGQGITPVLDAGLIEAAAPVVETATISGTVAFAGTATGATITLTPAEGEKEATVITTETDGTFSKAVDKGTYTLVVNKPSHTSYTYNGFEVAEDVEGLEYAILAGDVTGDGLIALNDLVALITYYQNVIDEESEEAAVLSDLNEDGLIALNDLVTLIGNYQKASVVEPTPAE